ncbi:hypothetical protein CW304_17010 [Bacillus sp. UFRGS-B20]|nr:hypothetical protein CW304_17010 [Bacillus sp. UFRGS-B20]
MQTFLESLNFSTRSIDSLHFTRTILCTVAAHSIIHFLVKQESSSWHVAQLLLVYVTWHVCLGLSTSLILLPADNFPIIASPTCCHVLQPPFDFINVSSSCMTSHCVLNMTLLPIDKIR